ncbi:unnamed protein product [Clonostachys rhizophaga]|uniref:Major facilitator superfamily (MFS) profile domain-containing protein n=1 Tax=Clonostachys rhizophaga TaxID=160324 RepID=A0A9N9YKH1_9HYPO|nr:unnamed protein product [Clonostachys rhizophaga]
MPRCHHAACNGSERTPLLGQRDSSVAPTNPILPRDRVDEQVVLAPEMSTTRLGLIMGTAWVGVFLMALDGTIVATLAAPISSEFRSLNMLSWIATAYLISAAAVLPITGRLTDIFGRGPGLVISNILFATGNLICGMATDQYTMLLGRALAGFGGGGLRSIQNFLASDLVPLRQRGITQGIANLCYGCGAMLGGLIGGLINDNAPLGWRLAFLAQVPPSLLSAIAVLFLVRVPPKQSDKSYLARIDFYGVFMSVSCTILMLLGLNSGGNLVPWSHPLPLTTIPLSVLLFIGFIWWETKAFQPIIPVKLLLNQTILSAALTNFFTDMVIMSALFYMPLYLQVIGYSATNAGRMILPSPIGDSLGALGAGYFMRHTGKYIWLGIPSVMLLVMATSFFSLQTETSPAWYSTSGFFLLGSSYVFIRSLGSTLGVTTASVVYQNTLYNQLWSRFGDWPDAANEIGRIREHLDELKHLPDEWYDGVMRSFMEAFRGVWLMMLGLALTALFCIAGMKQHQLHSRLSR